jgi:hypothetical protein
MPAIDFIDLAPLRKFADRKIEYLIVKIRTGDRVR